MNNYPKTNKRDDKSNNYQSQPQLPKFNPNWIKKGIDKECVFYCEELAKYLGKNVSSSFLRNIFGEIKRIEARGFESSKPDFYMLRPKVAYTVARAKERNDNPEAFKEAYEKMADQVETATDFKNLVNMIEAIVAFHKVYNPK